MAEHELHLPGTAESVDADAGSIVFRHCNYDHQGGDFTMLSYLKVFEKVIAYTLIGLMALVLLLTTVELAWIIVQDIISPPLFLLEVDELLDIFGVFLLVLIGVELIDTIRKTYLTENVIHVEVVVAVAIIAIARKVITLDFKDVSGVTVLGVAAIIISLSAGYYLLRRSR